MMNLEGVRGAMRVTGDRRQYELRAIDELGEEPAMNPIGRLTISSCIAAEFQRRCCNHGFGKTGATVGGTSRRKWIPGRPHTGTCIS